MAYPSKLVVYHAGVGRTVFLGASKIITFLLFGYGTAILAPAYYNDENAPLYMIPTCVIGSAIPMLFVARNTKPFVAYIHLLLPQQARVSRQALLAYLNSTRNDVVMDFSLLRFLGSGRTVRTRLGELRQKGETWGDISNITRVAKTTGDPKGSFFVTHHINHAKEPKLWTALHSRIKKAGDK